MISISDAARFSQESNVTRKFKSWRESVLDYLILSLLVMTIFSWAKVATVEASGLLCIPIDSNIGYSFNLAKYFNSRCAQVFENKMLLYYPYLLFTQWLLFSIAQKFWLKLPVVQNRFETFFEIFKELNLMMAAKGSDQNTKRIKDKLHTILQKRSFLLYLYKSKIILLLILAACIEFLLIGWISKTLFFFEADFTCHLVSHSPIQDLVCNLQPSEYIYITIICNLVINLAIFIMTCYILHFILSKKWQNQHSLEALKHYSCYDDICFCFSLFKTSTQEQECIQKAISKCMLSIKTYFEPSGARDFCLIKSICEELGLSIESNNILGDFFRRKNKRESLIEKENFEEDADIEVIMQQTTNISKQTIILLHPYPTLKDVFKHRAEFSISKDNIGSKNPNNFVAFMKPDYVYTTNENNEYSNVFQDRRIKYVTNAKFRTEVKQRALSRIDQRQRRPICTAEKSV